MKIEINENILCEYGCNQVAQFKLNNGKYCCSESVNSCSAVKVKNGKLKLVDKICPHCHQEFKQINIRTFANHVRWCDKNPKHEECCGKKFKEKLSNSIKENTAIKHGELKTFEVECFQCKTKFTIQEYENDFPTKERYFCSLRCGHQYSAKCASPENIKAGMKKFNEEHPGYWIKNRKLNSNKKSSFTKNSNSNKIKEHIKEIRKCKWCQKEFETFNDCISQCCSKSCTAKYREFKTFMEKLNAAQSEYERIKLEFRRYRVQVSFTFSLKNFPDEFDFSLIEKYGMYKAKNRGDNPDGISRDHMYSVKDGFLNKVDPKIIAHPANCCLIQQRQNASKYSKSSITLEELMNRIEIWNKKYGTIYNY